MLLDFSKNLLLPFSTHPIGQAPTVEDTTNSHKIDNVPKFKLHHCFKSNRNFFGLVGFCLLQELHRQGSVTIVTAASSFRIPQK